MPRFKVDPVKAVLAFIVVGTLVVWAIITLGGPGRPSDAVVLLSAAAPLAAALAFGWFLANAAE